MKDELTMVQSTLRSRQFIKSNAAANKMRMHEFLEVLIDTYKQSEKYLEVKNENGR
jgi:hypothetical protein